MTEEKRQLVMDFKDTFGSPYGQRVLEALNKRTTLNRPCLNKEGEVDLGKLPYEEGKRVMVLYIHEMINKDIETKKKARARNDRGS